MPRAAPPPTIARIPTAREHPGGRACIQCPLAERSPKAGGPHVRKGRPSGPVATARRYRLAYRHDGGEFDHIIRDVAHPHPGLHALLTFSAIDIAAFSPPRPPGVAAVTRTFDVHLDTFIRVLEVFIKDGMSGASAAGADRVGLFFRELFRISEDLRRYSSRHCIEFKGREADVFAKFKQDANLDWADFVSRLTTEASALRQRNTLAPPPPNTVGAIQVPQFSRTLVLIAEGTASSMVGLLQGGLARQQQSKPSSASTKRKATSQGQPARTPVAPVPSAATAPTRGRARPAHARASVGVPLPGSVAPAVFYGTQAKDGRGGTSVEGERLVNALTFGSLGSATNKVYQRMWNTWKEARAGAGSGPWLRECDGVESALQKSGRTTRGSCTRIFV
ncbi:unnamed protein product [Ectocarpus sp. CCAP 1310/34]|nr:unnamed protein product [Ectocarpus sp. CCAP 1310/34]